MPRTRQEVVRTDARKLEHHQLHIWPGSMAVRSSVGLAASSPKIGNRLKQNRHPHFPCFRIFPHFTLLMESSYNPNAFYARWHLLHEVRDTAANRFLHNESHFETLLRIEQDLSMYHLLNKSTTFTPSKCPNHN